MKKNLKTKKILLLKQNFKDNNFIELIETITFIEFIDNIKLKHLRDFCRFRKNVDLKIAIMMYNNLRKDGNKLEKGFKNAINQMNGDQKLLCLKN